MDVRMAVMDGLEAARQILAGASGFVLKEIEYQTGLNTPGG
jgi:CheY-like chemotaxis protein